MDKTFVTLRKAFVRHFIFSAIKYSHSRFMACFYTFVLSDLNMRIPLEDDIVRFDYIQSNMMSTEYFIYPKYNNNKNNKKSERKSNPKLKNRASQNPNRLNLMYIMIDSISRASAQRYLNATYKALDRDPNTVIMKVFITAE